MMYVALGGVVPRQVGVVLWSCVSLCGEILKESKGSFVRFICSDNLPTLGLVNLSHVAESC